MCRVLNRQVMGLALFEEDTDYHAFVRVSVASPVRVHAPLLLAFGDRICFSGGVDEQKLLAKGSPDDARAGVLKLLDDLCRGGCFFLGPTHNVQDDIPAEDILATYEAARQRS